MLQKNKVEIHNKSGLSKTDYELLIDGYIISGVTVGENYKEALGLPNYYVISKERDSLEEIAKLTYNEFRIARVQSIKLTNWTRWEGFNISVNFGKDFLKRKELTFEIEFEPDVANWKFPYSYNDYYICFRQIYETKFGEDVIFGVGGIKTEFSVVVDAILSDLPLAVEVERNLEQFVEIHKKTLSQLEDEQFENSLLASFNFPEDLKVPCEQYLLYFAQFLRDLGINATPNLKEEAGKVLFSIKPNDDIEALDKIREALEVYLRLPSSQIVSNSQEIAIQRLESQVEYFRSQIRLAKAELQLKEATIQQQQVTIIKLGENVMIDSMIKNVTPAENKSEFLGGSIEVMTPKILENYGVKKIDLDKFWKYMKEKFAKK